MERSRYNYNGYATEQDTQLTFAQEVKVDGAIIVSTPQDLALLDKGIQMLIKQVLKF